RHLQQDRLHRYLYRRHSDTVVFAKILETFDVRVADIKRQRNGIKGIYALDIDRSLGAVPDGHEAGNAKGHEINVVGKKCVVHHVGGTVRAPLDFYIAETGALGMLLDDLHVLHDHKLHVTETELLGSAQHTGFPSRPVGSAQE